MPSREVVFLAVGFETTAPGHALTLAQARREGVRNLSMLTAHVLVPPALRAIVADPECVVDGFLAAGHVCAITGTREYVDLAAREHVPLVVTGFEPLDILHGILLCVQQLEAGRAEVEIPYARAVRTEGNPSAQALLREVFTVVPQRWRGLGEIDASGLGIAPAYADFDAVRRFNLDPRAATTDPTREECQSGRVLIGRIKPPECPHFGTRCTPETPLGATMVSSEGACAAYFRYRRSA